MQDVVLSSWARIDPQAALESVSGTQLPETYRRFHQVIIQNWVSEDALSVIEQIQHIPPLLRSYAREQAIKSLASRNPTLVVELLQNPNNNLLQQSYVPILIQQWSIKDASSAIEWITNELNSPDLKANLLNIALLNMANYEPQKALKLALRFAHENVEQKHEENVALVIDVIASQDVSLAQKLTQNLTGNLKFEALLSISDRLIEQMDFDEAIALASRVSDANYARFFEHIFWRWLERHPQSLYDRLDELSEISKPIAASSLYSYGNFYQILSKAELDHVKSFIRKDDPVLERYP